ncbi:hypothetical protein Poly30_04680 [Planctomycetes bacterium Poly30]|uniref:DUF2188 domain-containing protein n=1 Tax=Saltatorellus ferox TaxID=2528018 RepID=A0A518ELK8_9BACT|nr:hypothetical protein Poly30_04680 [Planctomycetes bacterium Poly30]
MSTTIYHVVPDGDTWAVKRQGALQASRLADSQGEAIEYAEAFARNQAPSSVIVHDEAGMIESRSSFDADDRESSRSIVKHPAFLLGAGLAAGLIGFTAFAMTSDWGKSRHRPWN